MMIPALRTPNSIKKNMMLMTTVNRTRRNGTSQYSQVSAPRAMPPAIVTPAPDTVKRKLPISPIVPPKSNTPLDPAIRPARSTKSELRLAPRIFDKSTAS